MTPKPCPFCGSSGKKLRLLHDGMLVWCQECNAQASSKVWNERKEGKENGFHSRDGCGQDQKRGKKEKP